MGFIPDDPCSLKTTGLWICFFLTYLYGACQSASADTCSTTLIASEGEITSPGYSGTAYNYLTCTYVVVGDGQNQSIAIDLVQLDVHEGSNCYYDWLIIDDGPKLCRSHTKFHKTYVFQDRFIIKFRSDYRSTGRGFKIYYSVGVDAYDNCTSNHLTASGQISTPCYSCNCTYNNFTNTIIGSGKLQTLTLDFVSLNFTTSANCDLGWFTIDGGPRICTSTPFATTYAFFGSIDIVNYCGDQSVDSCGDFVVNYVVEDNCSTTLTASEGEITSPVNTGTPYNYLTCTYVIVGDGQNHSITINLVQLDLEVTHYCYNDWLIIGGGPKFCRSTTFHKTYVSQDRFIIEFRSDYRRPSRGFKMHYSVGVDGHDNCTSIHVKTSGQISTPCYSCNCTYNNCTNTIIGNWKMQTLTLNFVSLNFTTSANCDLGWLTIDGGPKLCTSTPFKTTYAFFGSVDIVTRGGHQSVGSCAGFVANYVVEDNCSTTLTTSEGEITSFGYPGTAYTYLTCTYVIVGDGQNQSIAIDLVQLDVNEGSNCTYDWLIIDDGPKLCHYRTTFHKTYVFWDRFIIKFRSDYGRTRRGFNIHYSVGVDAHDNCTSTHLTASGQISTPFYSYNCTYKDYTNTIIGSGKLQTLILDFVSLNFTTSYNCDFGWFTIDGGPKICTSTPFKTTYAFFGSVDIVTHGGDRSGDFVVNYVVEDNCSTTFTASEGEITSPGYPGIPYNYLTCTYVVVGNGHNQSIAIDLVKLDLTFATDCSYDWLIIDDGLKLCYDTTFHKTYIFRDRFIIKFRTDYRSKTRGFKMRYSIGVDAHDSCTSTHLTASGQISTPCYSCNCTYNNFTNTIIGSGKLQTLTLDFVSLNYTTSANCDLGWFTIDGGPKICTSTPFKTTYGFFVSVDIVTHGGGRSVNSAGFVVNYVVEDNCSTTFTASEGEITSPGYPGIPYNYLTCTYVVLGDGQNQSITIDLLQLDLNIGSDCPYDWLIIDDGPNLCYQTTFHKTYAFQDKFIIKFRSDYRRARYGFKMHYSVGVDANDTCTSTHLTTSGQISTPCFSCNCTYNNCTNTVIGTGKLQTLTLDFVSLIFTTSTNCDLGWFTIDGGPKLCTSTPFKTTYAFLGSADIVTHGGGRSGDSCGGFVVDYVVEDVDNNKLTYTTNSGQLVGPLFPGASSFSGVITTYIIVGHVPKQSLILDITLSSYASHCSYAKLTLNGTEDLCDTGRHSRTYFSQNNFTIEFRYLYNSSFLIHYEKEDITKVNLLRDVQLKSTIGKQQYIQYVDSINSRKHIPKRNLDNMTLTEMKPRIHSPWNGLYTPCVNYRV